MVTGLHYFLSSCNLYGRSYFSLLVNSRGAYSALVRRISSNTCEDGYEHLTARIGECNKKPLGHL